MKFPVPLWRRISEERKKFLSGFRPLVRFVMTDNSELHEFQEGISALISEFVRWCDPQKNANQAEVMAWTGVRWNEEGGIGLCYVDGEYVMHCKMCVCDGSPESAHHSSTYEPWRGILFRDHAEPDCRFVNTVKVFLIADAFEKFLLERGIKFTRDNMKA
jgi:hypothetical protein